MMPINIDKNFTNGWLERISGSGAVTITNGILRCTGSGSDQAMKDYVIPVSPGEIIEFSVMARSNNGNTVYIGFDLVDDTLFGTLLDKIAVSSQEWRVYTTRLVIPPNGPEDRKWLRIVLGKWSAVNVVADCEFQDPKLNVQSGFGGLITIACGLVRLVSGVVDIHPEFRSFNVKSVQFDGSTTVTVYLNNELIQTMRPLVFVSGTPEHHFIPMAGQVVWGVSSNFKIKWSNGAGFQNVAAIPALYAFFEVKM